ncbi:MAG TPA: hypothetical protein VMW45_04565 [Dehalococcoidia bacterium]|nr:hypothetical protein [Dehalococcoidia bacterium]
MKGVKITPEDRIFSEFIRKRAMRLAGGCERCLAQKYDIVKDNGSIFPAWKQLQCSHYWTRGSLSVRYDEDNACGLCGGCHIFFSSHHDQHELFFRARLGEERYERLNMRYLGGHGVDMKVVRIYVKQLLDEEDLHGK